MLYKKDRTFMSGLFVYREILEEFGKAGDETVADFRHIGFGGLKKLIIHADNVPSCLACAAAGFDRVVEKRTFGSINAEKLLRFAEDLRCTFV